MKFVLCLAVFVLGLVAFSEAAIARAVFKNSDYPGKCVIDANTVMSPGQTGKAPNHPCAGVTCMENSHVEFKTCAAVAPPKGCKLRDFVNTNRSYPECCERSYDCNRSFESNMTFAADNPLKKFKYFIIYFLVLFMSNYVAGWVASGFYYNDSYPELCYISEDFILEPGETEKMSNSCSMIRCIDESGFAEMYGCGAVAPPTNCKWGDYINIDAPYSECCAKEVVCDNPADMDAALEYQNTIYEMFIKATY
ncbi:uncharacterized protein LOC119666699 [Teleopsis dalmanni]|uniref:uncharacterized protein LOC119666699 n=1 Tax=Teleopsis dalmanni TaxID=139649 RepID=UPI0018CD0FE6|nr:uncharacterized protein LOC119666699 [Teleopsis dalmanni]